MIKKMTKDWKYGKDIGILIMRIVFGLTMFYGHGMPKWQKLFSGGDIQFADPLGVGVELSFYMVLLAEGVAFIFVVLGLYMRLALIPLIIAMAVAAFVFHSGQPFGNYELPFIYLFAYIALFFTGAGKFSIDEKLK